MLFFVVVGEGVDLIRRIRSIFFGCDLDWTSNLSRREIQRWQDIGFVPADIYLKKWLVVNIADDSKWGQLDAVFCPKSLL